MADELLARVRRLEDREAIRDLHNQYCFIHDRGHSSHAEADVQAFLGRIWGQTQGADAGAGGAGEGPKDRGASET